MYTVESTHTTFFLKRFKVLNAKISSASLVYAHYVLTNIDETAVLLSTSSLFGICPHPLVMGRYAYCVVCSYYECLLSWVGSFFNIRLQKVHKNGLGFAHPAFTSYVGYLPTEQMDFLSLVLCSIFVQSLDLELELTSFDTFIISLFAT
jgi:hypothetical protein